MSAKKKLLAATLGALAGVSALVAPAAAVPVQQADCTTYQEISAGNTFRPGLESVPYSHFWNNGDETFSFCVDVPDTAEVRVEVRVFSVPNQRWETVHTAPAGKGDKEFTYHVVTPSTYRLYVTGISGTGTYTAGLSFSRNGN